MFFDSEDFTTCMLSKGSKGTPLSQLKLPPLELRPFAKFTPDELSSLPVGSPMLYDVETFSNYFLCGFKCPERGKVFHFERSPGADFDGELLRWMMFRFCTVGFNSQAYDMLLVFAAAQGFNNAKLKALSDAIIRDQLRPRDAMKKFGFRIPFDVLNQIDLIEVAPLEGSLKLYAARMQAQRLQDLPFDPDKVLTEDEGTTVKFYNVNDLDNTGLLYNELLPEIKLRETLGKEYNQDLRSRSDAQIAEAVIASELTKLTGRYPSKPKDSPAFVTYEAPAWIGYQSEQLREAVNAIEAAKFQLDGAGSPMWPKGLGEPGKSGESWSLKVRIGKTIYQLGMGGLHSQETCVAHRASDDLLLLDRDVASYYPRIILNERLFPSHLGEAFLDVYEGLVNKRLAAKAAGIKTIANALKITINGGFGKFGSVYSLLYSPKLLLQVTITGQLALLMLIEMIEWHGIPVVSGNTDGVIIKCPADRYDDLNAVIAMWEKITGFETEETRYRATYNRDVNNYYAVKDLTNEEDDDKAKRLKAKTLADRLGIKVKGVYSEVGSALNSVLSKNPSTLVCSDAVLHMIASGTPVRETIEGCKDIRRFTTVRRVNGGAEKNGVYIGKVIRWYYAKNCPGPIRYIKNGNTVGKTEGAKPLMDLPPEFPTDVDFDFYVNEAEEILRDIAFDRSGRIANLFD
jgi:hypothetical protein